MSSPNPCLGRPLRRHLRRALLIRNSAGDVLLVTPSRRRGSVLVGDCAKPGEDPLSAAYRTAVLATGLTHLVVGDLLLVGHTAADPDLDGDESLTLVLDGGTVADDPAITLPVTLPQQDPVLLGWKFCPSDSLASMCGPQQARRIREAPIAGANPTARGLLTESTPTSAPPRQHRNSQIPSRKGRHDQVHP